LNALKREFIALAERSKWSQSEIARKLNMTRGGVNGIVTGEKIPGPRLVELFRVKLAADRPELPASHPPPLAGSARESDQPEMLEAMDRLREIQANAPKEFKTLQEMIVIMHEGVKASARRKASLGLPADLGERVERARAGRRKKDPDHPHRAPG
jgi:transcriptional regulator with XRE-family HTH domain